MKCSKCDDELGIFPYKCKFCAQNFCSKHRLPENHFCAGLENWKEKTKNPEEWIYRATNETKEKTNTIKNDQIIIMIVVLILILLIVLNLL